MKKTFLLIFIVLFFTACPWPERTIDLVIAHTIERNFSSHNVFIQYYLDDEIITRKIIYKGTENKDFQYDTIDIKEMLKNNFCGESGYDPGFSLDNPNKLVKKILVIDLDTNKILKRLEKTDDLYFLDHAEDNYRRGTRYEYWALDITDEWLH